MKTFNVISHTHWDREWYFPFEQFRLKLVDTIDNVFNILEEEPEYIFHLDAQAIVLEDYLEIRTNKRAQLEKYIKEGRLIVGPWYVQNDFYLTSGEATVRNLLIGKEIAGDFGKCDDVGYAPDQFGNISQLPQILQGFSIDNFIFGRGYQFYDNVDGEEVLAKYNTEFVWQGPDGSQLQGIYLRCWYNNAQRFSENIDSSMALLAQNENSFEGMVPSNELLMMNGVDHLQAQENLLPIIKNMNNALPDDKQIIQTSMHEYINKVKDFYEAHPEERAKLNIHNGELRAGKNTNILQNTLSSRIYLKKENARIQNLLENYLEPLYTLIDASGAKDKYPQEHLRFMWKELIKNHPHDSICGCSHDYVHNNMEDRFNRITVFGEELLKRGMDFLGAHINRDNLNKDDNIICVFNPLQDVRSEVVNVEVDFAEEENIEGIRLYDPSGNEIPFIVTKKERINKDIYSSINLPGVRTVDRLFLQFEASDIPGIGYKVYTVKKYKGSQKLNVTKEMFVSEGELENSHLKVTITDDGEINLFNKTDGITYKNILTIIDEADVGDLYRQRKPRGDKLFAVKDLKPQIKLVTDNELEKSYKLSYDFMLPKDYDFERDIRSQELVLNKLDITLSLKKGMEWLDIKFDIDNKSIDHRVRAIINTGMKNDISNSLIPFDIVSRDRKEILNGINNGDQPNSGFISVSENNQGIAILNEGIYEYEHYIEGEGSIALTLLRSVGYIARWYDRLEEISPKMITPGGNVLRKINIGMAIYPYGEDSSGELLKCTKAYQCPVLPYVQSADLTKYVGGRPAVQGTWVSEIFYREDKYKYVDYKLEKGFIKVENDNVVISAFKKAEDGSGIILRVLNGEDKPNTFSFTYCNEISSLEQVNLNEEKIKELSYTNGKMDPIVLKSKEILTVKFN
ncbi:alpha-mannosidase [Vallitalea okinawensis]|uniref:alpha-mannosidase n=1 Tax=Vallitalea okinawensis TaxID=2078660 RepID=UPI000CFD1B54|nr:glycoside hydrolase family 38 C-terminal domain-containing protein [Vallitalea okinawensis]